MLNKDEALTLALKALEAAEELAAKHDAELEHGFRCGIIVIKEALASTSTTCEVQPEQEPAAWMYPDDLKRFETSEAYAQAYSIAVGSPTQGKSVPLYTTPPQCKPLTDEQIADATGVYPTMQPDKWHETIEIARAIEAKLKEKNT